MASSTEAQVRSGTSRIDRIDRVTRAERAARAAEADRLTQRSIERREAQAAQAGDEPDRQQSTLLADRRLVRTRDGFPARRGEILALDMSDVARAAALQAGMTVISETPLGAGGSRLARLGAPPQLDLGAMLDLLRRADPQGVFDFNHAFAASGPSPQAATATAQPQGLTGSAYLIGMIDGGVLTTHPDLKRASISQRAFPESSGLAPTDHGTAVAGRLADTMARPFDLVVADVLTGTGTEWTGADSLAEGLAWMTAGRIRIVNISLAGPPNAVVERMVARHIAVGGSIVAAVGNGGPFSGMIYPAAYPGVIGVTATDSKGRVYKLASTGSQVDVSAPGVDVPVAALSGHVKASGTSYAAPVIAAQLCLKQCAATPAPELAVAH